MNDLSDAELLQRIADGGAARRDAELAFCRRYALRVELYGRKHLRDADSARDLAQSVLAGVLEAARAGRIQDPLHVERFVLGTCRNTLSRMRQQAARSPIASEAALAELSIDVPGALESIDRAVLSRCMSALEERATQVIVMSFVEQCSAEEIAVAQHLTTSNVRVIRHRALAALRKCLDGREAEA